MFANAELKRLAARKAELLARSEQHRVIWRQTGAEVRAHLSLVETGYSLALKLREVFRMAAPVAGLWAALRSGGISGWIARAAGIIDLVQAVRRFRHRHEKPADPASDPESP